MLVIFVARSDRFGEVHVSLPRQVARGRPSLFHLQPENPGTRVVDLRI